LDLTLWMCVSSVMPAYALLYTRGDNPPATHIQATIDSQLQMP
jgi:hypothetical protein